MISDRYFKIALFVSLIVHTTIFFNLPHINLKSKRRDLENVQVTYIHQKSQLPSLKLYNQAFSKKSSRDTASKKVAPPPYVKSEQIFKSTKNISLKKPELLKPEIIAIKKKITLPPLTDEKIANPIYLNYYQLIREKIRRAAYQNYTRLVNGEVYLSFIILSSGRLKDVRINENKTRAFVYLKDTAKKSIYDASPFPVFPKDLDYPELSFNVIISFEVE